jgi:hypothetical protein
VYGKTQLSNSELFVFVEPSGCFNMDLTGHSKDGESLSALRESCAQSGLSKEVRAALRGQEDRKSKTWYVVEVALVDHLSQFKRQAKKTFCFSSKRLSGKHLGY